MNVANRYFLYHAHCEDGFASALVPWRIFGREATYVPVAHGDPPPPLPNEASVVITDFSYSRDVLVAMSERVNDLTVLDHHKTAEDQLRGLPFAHFDMEKSGATLSWDFWHPDEPVPELLRYVEDRDLWRFALPRSNEVNAAIGSYPYDFGTWDRFDVAALAEEGVHILRARNQYVATLADRVAWKEVGGHKVPVVNTANFNSDLLSELNRRHPAAPFAACYCDLADGRRRWSLASVGDFDVGSLAARLGGGGHPRRSGFIEPA